MRRYHHERHRIQHIGWLRAAVLGANDGIVSTASLIVGVASAGTSIGNILIAGIAGLVAGAMSMAAGEYVSVSSQRDTENADIARERKELASDVQAETRELAGIYVERGLSPELAAQVADELMAKDALGAHMRDELGITGAIGARPVQAALTSAASFAVGAGLPLGVTMLVSVSHLVLTVMATSLVFLAGLGALSAYMGGARIVEASARVTFWGALAMALTAAVGRVFDVSG